MDSVSKEALKAVMMERDRLAQKSVPHKPGLKAAEQMLLPKRNLRQKLETALRSPHRVHLVIGLIKILIARIKFLRTIGVFFTFPREIIRLQEKVEALEFQIVEQKVRFLEISKSRETR